jgi:hypothetical protein
MSIVTCSPRIVLFKIICSSFFLFQHVIMSVCMEKNMNDTVRDPFWRGIVIGKINIKHHIRSDENNGFC